MAENNLSLQVQKKHVLLAILVCFLPFVVLGPYSFVRVHDNGDSILPGMIILANLTNPLGESDYWSWLPFQATGVPTFSQGMLNLYQIPFFASTILSFFFY